MPSPLKLISPLSPTDLFLESMTDNCGLSLLGETQLRLLSPSPDIKGQKLLGKPVSVECTMRGDAKRWFSGYVTGFGVATHGGRYYGYEAMVRPWLWFLTRTTDCRIFQDMTVPDIVKAVFADHSVADFKFNLARSYRKWIYCVQYRESDYSFVARLLEQEGIYWYFEHASGSHKLILVDAQSAHDALAHCATLPYYENAGEVPPDIDYLSNWTFQCEVQPGSQATTSYDFKRPGTSLAVQHETSQSHDLDNYEMFDFQGDFSEAADGKQAMEDRSDEHHARFTRLRGSSSAQGLAVGGTLEITRHPRDDQNGTILVCATTIHARADAYESVDEGFGNWHCDFNAQPASQQFRPQRHTPKPVVQGPQTAVVVGPAGDEIYTDPDGFGRVKVQFHWDRYGKKDEKSSCWVRVSHPWAGRNFGMFHIPRIGQEVIVDFLEGDPDQPIITGRVHNADQMPPWTLPASMTRSGILTRSTKGGAYANANEISFEDKKGSEQLKIHAEKNQDIEVEHDETHWVGHDRTKTIDHDETSHIKHDRTETVDHDETITVHGKRTEVVDKDETITIHQNRTETVDKEEKISIHGGRTEIVDKDESITIHGARTEKVDKDEHITIDGGRTEKVAKDESITIDGGRTETVAKDEKITINGGRTETVAKDEKVTINGGRSETIAKDEGVTISGGRTVKVDKDDSLTVGKNLKITASDSISLTTGSASITMNKDGTIVIKGKDIKIDGKDISVLGSGKINAKADSDIVMKGSKILHN
jgi:type VI secretion system secreted protein VgrG